MIKYNSLPYNTLNTIKYNSESVERIVQLVSRLGPRPIVLDQEKRQIAVLENSYEVWLDQEVDGIDELTFNIPLSDSKRSLLKNEEYILMFDTIYVIREIIDYKKDHETEVFAEAIWYDIQYSEPLDKLKYANMKPALIAADILSGTGWKLGKCDYTNARTLETTDLDKNRLEMLQQLKSILGAELKFDTQAMKVDIVKPTSIHTGAAVTYEKNADDIEAHYDTKDLITKLYLYGKDGMTIGDANNGVKFIENYSYTTKKHVRSVQDERYTNPFQLKDMGVSALEYLCKPRASYIVKMRDLSTRTGLEHEDFFIGGLVTMYDKEIDLNFTPRIEKWKYNVIEPWRTELSLEKPAKELSDLLTGLDGLGETTSSEDSVKEADMLNLSVFNYLMNGRADDGFSYWTNTGWEVDAVNGHSGNASFKAVGSSGSKKSLFQTVYPSSRDAYALSFRAFATDIKKGTNGRVGVEVTITYEDGTTETRFVALA